MSFARATILFSLLAVTCFASAELAETTVQGGKKLLCFGGSCVRPLSTVQSHKTPTAPKITRKTFNQGPKKALLAAETELATAVDSGRKLLCFGGSCVRPIAKTQSHKTPNAPKITRKTFNQGPKKALLAAETELAIEVLAESGRKLLCFGGSCVRPISKTQAHKTPTAPKITRKSFDRKMP
jgi:hypothetical protein